MKEVFMQKIANDPYDFYPLPQMLLDTEARTIRIKDGEIVKEWSTHVTYFKFTGEAINVAEHKVIQNFIANELKKFDYSFIYGTHEDGELNEFHILVKNKSQSGKRFDFDKVKFRDLKRSLL